MRKYYKVWAIIFFPWSVDNHSIIFELFLDFSIAVQLLQLILRTEILFSQFLFWYSFSKRCNFCYGFWKNPSQCFHFCGVRVHIPNGDLHQQVFEKCLEFHILREGEKHKKEDQYVVGYDGKAFSPITVIDRIKYIHNFEHNHQTWIWRHIRMREKGFIITWDS